MFKRERRLFSNCTKINKTNMLSAKTSLPSTDPYRSLYTCPLFLRYKHEIFNLGVLGFLKMTRSFPKIISEEVRSLPKAKLSSPSLRTRINASSLPVLFTSKIRDHEERIVISSFYTWFSFLTWVRVNIFLEIVSSKTATTHIFQSGMRN